MVDVGKCRFDADERVPNGNNNLSTNQVITMQTDQQLRLLLVLI